MTFRRARPPDPLKHVQQPEFPDPGKHLRYSPADYVRSVDLLDLLGPVAEVNKDKVVAVIHSAIDSHARAGVAHNRLELGPDDFQLLPSR